MRGCRCTFLPTPAWKYHSPTPGSTDDLKNLQTEEHACMHVYHEILRLVKGGNTAAIVLPFSVLALRISGHVMKYLCNVE